MTSAQSMPAELYPAVRDELIEALAQLDETAAHQSVPACPEWTVKDVAAHLCGLNAELLADVQGGLGTDEATTRQVGDRSTDDLAQVLAEWKAHAPAIQKRFGVNPDIGHALLADLVIHVYDLVEVLDQPIAEAAAATPLSAHRYIPRLQNRLAEEMNVGITVELSDGTSWPAEAVEGAKNVTVQTDPRSFLQGVTGRLRREQVEAFDWSVDPTAILDTAWNQYGPFRV